ncbi:fidgetin-like protein 2 [Willisornis vidua]|uniref:Fidgetin-like protein 2 n=1 Tax=Willisornis vidua TaxID=1566151 RepID=A0ABQ9DYI0_9PASS|nr:fidgetin-like protein 2 [Willisornis vidua]
MLVPVGLTLLLLTVGGSADDTVAATVGRHTMGRIAELLSPSECHQLQAELNGPDEELAELQHLLERSSPVRRRRSRRGPSGCSEALRHWMVTAGETVTWDRLVRSLSHIGRSDIARELGKNLNQDRSLQLQRNVQGYSQSVQHLSSVQLQPQPGGPRGRRAPHAGTLLLERLRPPRYGRDPLGWVQPVVVGVLGAFLTSIFLTVTLMYYCHWRRLLGA